MHLLNATNIKLSRGKSVTGPSILPTPDKIAEAHSHALLAHIIEVIQSSEKLISFADYMQLALYHPTLGYYAAGTQKFGAAGDFVTAPEISPLFSRCLAREICCVFQFLSGGDILEIGAGTGQMAADILIELQSLNSLPTRYFILELSPELQHRQQETLQRHCPHLLPLVHWLQRLPTTPIQGVALANEVCDAMPTHRFLKKNGTLFEIGVGSNQGALQWGLRALENTTEEDPVPKGPTQTLQTTEMLNLKSTRDHNPSLTLSDLEPFLMSDAFKEEGDYLSEINLNLKPWIDALSEQVEAGVFLIIDYGFPRQEYYHPDRHMGTLMCHFRHHLHADPFFYPGLQDITAHVDFTALAEAALGSGLEVMGFTNQASFLIGAGLLNLTNLTLQPAFKQNQAIQTLTSPAEMGELFKVIGFSKNCSVSLAGFSLNDMRYRL